MAFELNIKNIGKLTDAKIHIGQFTVFAGPNNTGKSFVSKVLYSLFDAMNANHAEVYIDNLTVPLRNGLKQLMRWRKPDNDNRLFEELDGEIKELEALIKESPIGDLEELDKAIPELTEKAVNIRSIFLNIRSSLKSSVMERESVRFPPFMMDNTFKHMEQSLTELQKAFSGIDAKEIIASGIDHKIRENLIQNFQVPNIADLRGKVDTPSEIDMGGIAKFRFSDEENGEIAFEINSSGIWELQQCSRVIYLESPAYWKLKNALETLRIYPRYLRGRREQLSGVPGYFYDLAGALKYQYTGNIAFPDLYERLTSKEVIGGKIAISESGNLSFQENGRSFSLPVTAIGVASIGILALLIERKVLDEESFIFIDEPEAHLHPAWQVIMAETLFELAKKGVKVVIATHSAEILKWLEVHIKKNPDDEGMVALNKFPTDAVNSNGQNFKDKIAAIKQELTKPFADLYTAGL